MGMSQEQINVDLFDEVKRLKAENRELKSLCLWSIRRVHKTHKEFAYNEYEKITGEKPERV